MKDDPLPFDRGRIVERRTGDRRVPEPARDWLADPRPDDPVTLPDSPPLDMDRPHMREFLMTRLADLKQWRQANPDRRFVAIRADEMQHYLEGLLYMGDSIARLQGPPPAS